MPSYRDHRAGNGPGTTARFITLLGYIIAVAIAVFPPLVYFYITYQMEQVQLHAEASNISQHVTEFINTKPHLWKYDAIRLRGVLALNQNRDRSEIRRIRDEEGNIVIQLGQTVDFPVITSSQEVMDAGRVVGRFVMVRSVRPILVNTGWVAIIGLLLALAELLAFKTFPLKTLYRTFDTLADERDRAQVTLDSIGDCVIVADPEGNVVTLNRVGEQVTEWTQDDARGKPLSEVIPLNRASGGTGGEQPPRDTVTKIEIHRDLLVTAKGRERIIDGVITPIYDRNDNRRGSVFVCRDITEKVREEDEVFKARKLESIGILAGGIAHDFNNILVGIMGNLSLAKLSASPGTNIFDRIEEAEKASTRAKELSSRLLAFSKGGKPARKLMPVSDLLRESASLAARGSASRVLFHIQEDLWMAEVDPVQLDQAIGNLVVNAVHAMKDGGTIQIEAQNAVVAEGELVHVKGGDYLKIFVRDEGPGIPEDIREKIFDPYFTTKRRGSGLGLTTTYTIMKSHRGNIFLESETGVGTTFVLFLPAVRQAAPSVTPLPEERSARGSGKILVMDDEEMVLDVAGQMLAHLGYEPVLARNGEEAIELFSTMSTGGSAIDLLLLDLTVPGGMGGIEAAKRIREIDPDAKILVSSGYANNAVMAQYREHGFAGRIVKPYKISELGQMIGTIVRSASV